MAEAEEHRVRLNLTTRARVDGHATRLSALRRDQDDAVRGYGFFTESTLFFFPKGPFFRFLPFSNSLSPLLKGEFFSSWKNNTFFQYKSRACLACSARALLACDEGGLREVQLEEEVVGEEAVGFESRGVDVLHDPVWNAGLATRQVRHPGGPANCQAVFRAGILSRHVSGL